MSRNAANASAMSNRDLPPATRMYAEGDTARSAYRLEGDASASIPYRAGASASAMVKWCIKHLAGAYVHMAPRPSRRV